MMVGSYISPKHHEADDFCSKWETSLLSRTPCCPYEREQRMPANLLLCSLLARCGKDCMKEIRETCMIASNIPSSKGSSLYEWNATRLERQVPYMRGVCLIGRQDPSQWLTPELLLACSYPKKEKKKKKNSLTLVIPDNTTPCYESIYSGTVHIEFEKANIRWMLTLRPLLGLGEIIGTWRAWRQAWSCKPSRVEKNHSVKQPLQNFMSRFHYIELYIVMNNGIAVFPNFP